MHADAPLLHPSATPPTALEQTHTSLLTSLAHQARSVLQLRGLDTGRAKDVTGVVRVSRGGEWREEDDGGRRGDEAEKDGEDGGKSEGEWLYFVGGGGDIKVWGRGEGGIGIG